MPVPFISMIDRSFRSISAFGKNAFQVLPFYPKKKMRVFARLVVALLLANVQAESCDGRRRECRAGQSAESNQPIQQPALGGYIYIYYILYIYILYIIYINIYHKPCGLCVLCLVPQRLKSMGSLGWFGAAF